MRNLLAVAGVLAAVSACSLLELPQTPGEFRQLTLDYPRWYAATTHVAERRFETVVSSLESSVAECMNFNRGQTRTQGGMMTMSMQEAYRTSIRPVDDGRAMLIMQEETSGAIQPQQIPPGGTYEIVVDIERLTANSTNVTFYGHRDTDFREFVERAADGAPVPCPV